MHTFANYFSNDLDKILHRILRSIASMFFGGILTGVIIMVICYFVAKKRNYPRGEKVSRKDGLRISRDAILALMSALFVGCGIGNIKVEKAVKGMLPMYIAMIVVLLLVTFVPMVSLGIPSLIYGPM